MHLVRHVLLLLATLLAVVDARSLDGGNPQADEAVAAAAMWGPGAWGRPAANAIGAAALGLAHQLGLDEAANDGARRRARELGIDEKCVGPQFSPPGDYVKAARDGVICYGVGKYVVAPMFKAASRVKWMNTPLCEPLKKVWRGWRSPVAPKITSIAPKLASDAAKTTTQLEFGFAKQLDQTSGLVIGRGADLAKPGALGVGEYKLGWMSVQKTSGMEAEWAVNQGKLQNVMNLNKPIRDASPLSDIDGFYLNRERGFLQSSGWTYQNGHWLPPTP